MYYLLHGDYHLTSRNFLVNLIDQAKKNNKEIIQIDGKKTDLNQLIQACQSQSLFGNEKLVIIENLFSRQKSKELKSILEWVKKISADIDLIFWESKKIGKILQRNLPVKATVKEFKTPAIIFKLVEQINPQNKKLALQTLEQALQSQPAEFIFAMIVRQIKILILVKNNEKVAGAPWMIGKFKKQAESFSLDQLLTTYQKLFTIDRHIKTGQIPMPMNWHLSVWLFSL
jgi:DNA polymerase III delta subunit